MVEILVVYPQSCLETPVWRHGIRLILRNPVVNSLFLKADSKPQERDFEGNGQIVGPLPGYLPTSMNELYEKVYPGKPPVIEGPTLSGGVPLCGHSQGGKSFLMAQLGYHVSMGLPLWGVCRKPWGRPLSGFRG